MQLLVQQPHRLILATNSCPKHKEVVSSNTKSLMATILLWSKEWCLKHAPSCGWRWLTISNLTSTSDGPLSPETSTSSASPITSAKWSTISNITMRSQQRTNFSRTWNHTTTKSFPMPLTSYRWLSAWKSQLIDRTKVLSSNSSHLKKYSTYWKSSKNIVIQTNPSLLNSSHKSKNLKPMPHQTQAQKT